VAEHGKIASDQRKKRRQRCPTTNQLTGGGKKRGRGSGKKTKGENKVGGKKKVQTKRYAVWRKSSVTATEGGKNEGV